jgi:hypothetical protein
MRPRRLLRFFARVRSGRTRLGSAEPLQTARFPAPPVSAASICIGGIDAAALADLQALARRVLVDARGSVQDERAAVHWAARWLALILWLRAARGDLRARRLLECLRGDEALSVSPAAASLLADLVEQELLLRG